MTWCFVLQSKALVASSELRQPLPLVILSFEKNIAFELIKTLWLKSAITLGLLWYQCITLDSWADFAAEKNKQGKDPIAVDKGPSHHESPLYILCFFTPTYNLYLPPTTILDLFKAIFFGMFFYFLPWWIIIKPSFGRTCLELYRSTSIQTMRTFWKLCEVNSCSYAVTGLYLIPTDFQLFPRADLFSELRSWKTRNQKSCEWSSRFRWWFVSKCFHWMWYPYRH